MVDLLVAPRVPLAVLDRQARRVRPAAALEGLVLAREILGLQGGFCAVCREASSDIAAVLPPQ